VEHLLHPEYVPGVPLPKLTPEWILGRIFLSYFVGVMLILAGVCLLVNKKAPLGGLIDILLLAICAVASVSTRVDPLECADLVSALVFGDLSPPSRR
jgi:hypothetical protein